MQPFFSSHASTSLGGEEGTLLTIHLLHGRKHPRRTWFLHLFRVLPSFKHKKEQHHNEKYMQKGGSCTINLPLVTWKSCRYMGTLRREGWESLCYHLLEPGAHMRYIYLKLNTEMERTPKAPCAVIPTSTAFSTISSLEEQPVL